MYIYTHLSDVINHHLTYFCLHIYGVNNLLVKQQSRQRISTATDILTNLHCTASIQRGPIKCKPL